MVPTLRAACVFDARVVGLVAGEPPAGEAAEAARAELQKNLPWAQRWLREYLGERDYAVASAELVDYISQRGLFADTPYPDEAAGVRELAAWWAASQPSVRLARAGSHLMGVRANTGSSEREWAFLGRLSQPVRCRLKAGAKRELLQVLTNGPLLYKASLAASPPKKARRHMHDWAAESGDSEPEGLCESSASGSSSTSSS